MAGGKDDPVTVIPPEDGLELGAVETGSAAQEAPAAGVETGEPAAGHATAATPPPGDAIGKEWLAAQIGAVAGLVEQVSQRLDRVAGQIKRKDDIIIDLNEEAKKGREGIALELMRPIFSALVRILGELDTDIALRQQTDRKTADLLQAYRIKLRNALEDCGLIEDIPTDLEAAPEFGAGNQEIVHVVEAASPELHQKLARVVLPRFTYADRVLFREKVEVYRYRAPAQSREDSQ